MSMKSPTKNSRVPSRKRIQKHVGSVVVIFVIISVFLVLVIYYYLHMKKGVEEGYHGEESKKNMYPTFSLNNNGIGLSLEKAFEKEIGRPIDPIHLSLFSSPDYILEDEVISADESRGDNEWERKLNKYIYYRNNGKEDRKSKKIVVTGLLRNSEKVLPSWQKWVREWVKDWKDYRIVVSENNSVDSTREFLLHWSTMDDKVMILCDDDKVVNQKECNLQGIFQTRYNEKHLAPDRERIQKMSILRNLYHDYICNNYSDFDYVLVIDFDLNGELYQDGIEHSLGLLKEDPKLDAVACNGMLWESQRKEYEYYDSFAHIDKGESFLFSSLKEKQQHDEYVHLTINDLYWNFEAPREVQSAFGGCCLYRMKPFCDAKYGYSEDFISCEHGHFHQTLRMIVNPNMVFLIKLNNGFEEE